MSDQAGYRLYCLGSGLVGLLQSRQYCIYIYIYYIYIYTYIVYVVYTWLAFVGLCLFMLPPLCFIWMCILAY